MKNKFSYGVFQTSVHENINENNFVYTFAAPSQIVTIDENFLLKALTDGRPFPGPFLPVLIQQFLNSKFSDLVTLGIQGQSFEVFASLLSITTNPSSNFHPQIS